MQREDYRELGIFALHGVDVVLNEIGDRVVLMGIVSSEHTKYTDICVYIYIRDKRKRPSARPRRPSSLPLRHITKHTTIERHTERTEHVYRADNRGYWL